ncbi:HAD family hydrolase [Salidesulfovibrio onnuriiensis]|uniref:HAD family hydrolase n=1 Tax=Salidesulfovibrio onnuriiensis TaxID=2583823 RepID=UPI0011CCC4AA|nr:HAD family hydrolase [Salidesulfovibrio onnuriiensis]
MRRFDALIFDFDGTLANVPLDFDLMRTKIAALAEGFLAVRPETDGQPILEWIDELAAEIAGHEGRDAGKEFHCRARLTITATEIDAARQGELFEFTRPMLETLRERGVAAGVITRNITPAVLEVFPDLPGHVGAFIPREDAVRVKPDPEHLHQALRLLGVRPGRALMVGDHLMDIETGHRAGTASAGVATGRISEAAFREAGAEFTAPHAGELLKRLLRDNLL